MEIDRALVKSQAKQLIKGKVFRLFIMSFIVALIVNVSIYIYAGETVYKTINHSGNSSSVFDYFEDFATDDGNFNKDYFNQFKGEVPVLSVGTNEISGGDFLSEFAPEIAIYNVKKVVNIISFFMSPIIIGLYGVYLQFINGRKFRLREGLNSVFSSTFNSTYAKKLGLIFIKRFLTAVLTSLFIVPGVIFILKYMFAAFVMAENPEMSISQSMRVSKKITDGHKGELFRLYLSFVGWFLLSMVTLGIANIYFAPYVYTVTALYYENFKGRAIAEMKVNQFDFMSSQQRIQYYYQQQANNQQYQNDNQSSNTDYYNNIYF